MVARVTDELKPEASPPGARREGRLALSVEPSGLPLDLRSRPSWVPWAYEPDAAGRLLKVPYDARTGGRADPTDPRTWGPFDAAYDYYCAHRLDGRGGVGVVFPRLSLTPPAERLVGLDLDGCRDPRTGELDPFAADVLRSFGSFTDVSPSGTGVKAIARGWIDPNGRKRSGSRDPHRVELYCEGRYFALTGVPAPGYPRSVEARGGAAADLQQLLLPSPGKAQRVRPADGGYPGSDETLLVAAFAARNGEKVRAYFQRGEFGGHPTASEALLSLAQHLAFWTGPDPDRLDRLLRQSVLWDTTEAERQKWDSKRGRSTWGMKYVVLKAIDTCRTFYAGTPLDLAVQTGVGVGADEEAENLCKRGRHLASLAQAWQRVIGGEYPPRIETLTNRDRHTQLRLRRLAALCWHLAGRTPGGQFFLSGAIAGKQFGVDQTTANRWLTRLRARRVIRRLRPGNSLAGVASEYVWLGIPSPSGAKA